MFPETVITRLLKLAINERFSTMVDLVAAPRPSEVSIPEIPMRLGRLLVITGPSGVGKGTLIERLLGLHPDIHYSISVTTRPPRPGEQDGVNYYFRTKEEFLELQESGGLLEWAEYANNYYGTPYEPVLERIRAGRDVLLEIELDGSRQVVQHCTEAIRIFLQPPSMDELERRLRERAQDSEASIQRRLAQARTELEAIDEFDHVIVNKDVDQALHELECLLFNPVAPAGMCSADLHSSELH